MEAELKMEPGFFHKYKKPEEKTKLIHIQLDGGFVWGASGLGVFADTKGARLSFNQNFRYSYKRYGFNSPTELRKYLEKEGRLVYPEIEL
jgi:hypothetical protein